MASASSLGASQSADASHGFRELMPDLSQDRQLGPVGGKRRLRSAKIDRPSPARAPVRPDPNPAPARETEDAETGPAEAAEAQPAGEVMAEAADEAEADAEVKKIMNDGDSEEIESIDDDETQVVAEACPAQAHDPEPELVELSDDEMEGDDEGEGDEAGSSEEDEIPPGDPNKPPGEGAERSVDPAHLLPFKLGWVREVVVRIGKNNSATQYDVYYLPPPDTKYRTREAKRKRRSKADQEKYFADFPSREISVANFYYVRKPLGLNNTAYEIVRKANSGDPPSQSEGTAKPGNAKATTAKKSGKKAKPSYKELEESAGLVESDDEFGFEEEKIEFKEGLDLAMPISLQIRNHCMAMRAENKKRRRVRDPETCCTPPMAEDMLWSGLDNDPLGVYTELGGRSSPVTPPPLRAVRLTQAATATKILKAYGQIKAEAAQVRVQREPELKEDLVSHDLAIKRFRNFVQHANRNNFSRLNSVTAGDFQSNQAAAKRQNWTYMKPRSNADFKVKVKLPMPIINGRRPVVELVMEQNGKYIPIKFSNNMQVTEAIPKSLFEKANAMRKTFYQNASQVPKVGNKPIFLAINPSSTGVNQLLGAPPQRAHNQISTRPRPQIQPPASASSHRKVAPAGLPNSDQVSILVRPQKGFPTKPVLLNVPRSVALKVKPGTTLSFSASNDQKYVVIDSKIHPPVGVLSAANGSGRSVGSKPSGGHMPNKSLPITRLNGPGATFPQNSFRRNANAGVPNGIPNLPKSVSIRPISNKPSPATSFPRRINMPTSGPVVRAGMRRPAGAPPSSVHAPVAKKPMRPSASSSVLSSGEIVSGKSPLEPCTPYCPGVQGFPELECRSCQSLFHAKCVGINPLALNKVKGNFRCRMCLPTRTSNSATAANNPQIINLD